MTPKLKIPSIKECVSYMETCNYKLRSRCRGGYVFVDTTGNRPLHIREMYWNLSELRHAVKYGW